MSLPRISIVTPSYNQRQYIEETILSVLNQDYPNFEYIIIDGGSTDGSVDIIRRYSGRLAFWVSEKDNGFAEAINKGFRKATGEIFFWINSDDVLVKDALKIVGNYFAKFPDAQVVFGDRYIIDEKSARVRDMRFHFYHSQLFRNYKNIGQEATFWRREIFTSVGGIDESLHYAIDLDLWCRFSLRTKLHYIPFFLGAFRQQPGSKTSSINNVGKLERDRIVTKYFGKLPTPWQIILYNSFIALCRRLYRRSGVSAVRKYYYTRLLNLR